ncbi:hypothetical protein [Bacillus toyonensis]|uniref:hypothetical protein n=1 Tax=Bacillus toyonensis TaxID=155322 RepID=UPI000BF148B0|nr:hypothetical protein [Bacillus toyonensis]PEK75621.1 hypothetical protein CN594_30105 [Bacillus toyonensis]PFY35445.1 hypothetical protein COL54_29220 [Bacillus toyonensis]PFY35735.1 hypothetical protein COL55_30665 [Bacillus toyonensis]PFY68303.1 hypothetical protein COL62_26490 [Bacillus toyonensis]PGD19544.1 hypothetical protein COM37_20070 [Bacillus toyonensis]
MGCSNGNLLTERQVELLKDLLHEYHSKEMGVCSCDVERVLSIANTNHQSVHMQNDSLLIIKVQDMGSVPSVTYKGKDIKGKVVINYEWTTDEFEKEGKYNMTIKHIEDSDKFVVGKTITEERFN